MDYGRFFSELAKRRVSSKIDILTRFLENASPSFINLTFGMPNSKALPFKDAVFHLEDGSSLTLSSEMMKKALQYSNTPGLADFLKLLKELQERIHNPPTLSSQNSLESGMDVIVSPGSQDAIAKTMECLLNPGDSVLLEEPTYPLVLSFMKPMGYNVITLRGDKDGLIPESLREVMSQWPKDLCNSTVSKEIPRVLYLIPTGGNPTGMNISMERRKEIYKIAQEYGLVIVEDDPYYFMNFDKEPQQSFLSLDTDGRVIRLDSFSKIVSPGIRVACISGPKAILKKIEMHNQCTLANVSGISQLMVFELLKQWGIEGFLEHTKTVCKFYENKKNLALKYAEKWLTGLAEWNEPRGGLFLWITIPKVKNTDDLALQLAEDDVFLLPGNMFMVNQEKENNNIRISYSFVDDDQLDQGFQKLSKAIRSNIGKNQ